MKNQVLNIIVPNDPNGLKIIELSGWSGKAFIIPRGQLGQIKDRPEVNNPGIYFLFGKNNSSEQETVYIGESESFLGRLERHNATRDDWEQVVVFTGSIDRADVKYLENKSTIAARKAERYEVLNVVQPHLNHLSEARQMSVEDYYSKIIFILNLFGYSIFQSAQDSLHDSTIYHLKVGTSKATGSLLDNGEFIIYQNSDARIKETPSFAGFAKGFRQALLVSGSFGKSNDESYVFMKNVIFKSPSAAAATVGGRSINGWTAWKDERGKTLDENVRK